MGMGDLLGVADLVGGLASGLGAVADPYFYTDQEKQRDALAAQNTQTQQQAIQATAAANQAREETTRQAITYGLAGVLGVSLLYLGSKLVD